MKKFLSILLVGTMILSFAACEKASKKSDDDKSATGSVVVEDGKQTNTIKEEKPEDVVLRYFKSRKELDADAYRTVFTAEYAQDLALESDEEIIQDHKEYIAYYEEVFGKGLELNVTINKVSPMGEDFLGELKEANRVENPHLNVELTEVVLVEYTVVFNADKEDTARDGRAYVVKENGEWKIESCTY